MRSMTNLLLILLVLVFATGCASAPKTEIPDPVVVTKYITTDCGEPPQRSAVNLRPIEWRIIEGRFTLSPEGYEDLGYNVSMILAGIRELRGEVEFYERCLSSSAQKQGPSEDSTE